MTKTVRTGLDSLFADAANSTAVASASPGKASIPAWQAPLVDAVRARFRAAGVAERDLKIVWGRDADAIFVWCAAGTHRLFQSSGTVLKISPRWDPFEDSGADQTVPFWWEFELNRPDRLLNPSVRELVETRPTRDWDVALGIQRLMDRLGLLKPTDWRLEDRVEQRPRPNPFVDSVPLTASQPPVLQKANTPQRLAQPTAAKASRTLLPDTAKSKPVEPDPVSDGGWSNDLGTYGPSLLDQAVMALPEAHSSVINSSTSSAGDVQLVDLDAFANSVHGCSWVNPDAAEVIATTVSPDCQWVFDALFAG